MKEKLHELINHLEAEIQTNTDLEIDPASRDLHYEHAIPISTNDAKILLELLRQHVKEL